MTDVVDIEDDRVRLNAGQFDTDFRYLRTTTSGVMTTMLAGPSIAETFNQSLDRISYRYECGGYVLVATSLSVSPPGGVANVPTGIAL